MCAWFEPGTMTPVAVHAFGSRLYTLCSAHRGGIQVPDGRRTRPTGLDPMALQARVIEAYAVDLVPEETVRSLLERPPTLALPYRPSISVVPVTEEGSTQQTWRGGIDTLRAFLGRPGHRGSKRAE